MPQSAVYYGTGSFRGNRELTEVTFAYGVTKIADETFYRCSSLTAITFSDGVTIIGEGAFHGCSSLTAITIPDGVTKIGNYAFHVCSSLTTITIPDSVTTIGDGAFSGCSALTKLSLSPAVAIGEDCFSNCTALIAAAADQNMSTVEDLLNSRWHRILERVAVLSCLKAPWNDLENQRRSDKPKRNSHLDGDEVVALQGIAARKMLPMVMWRVILEFV